MNCPDCDCPMTFAGILAGQDCYWCPECEQEYNETDGGRQEQ